MAQDPALEFLELRPGSTPSSSDEDLSRGAVGLECVLLADGAIEREYVLRPEALPVRLLGDEPLELGQQLVVTPERELGVVELVPRATADPRAAALPPATRSRQVGERRAVQSFERAPQILGRIAAVHRAPPCPSTSRSNRSTSSSPGFSLSS